MNCLTQLFRAKRELPPPVTASLRAWRVLEPVAETAALARIRFAVVDVETSGLNPRRDRLLSVGAVGVAGLRVAPQDTFSAVLRNELPTRRENIVVHGLTPTAQAAGEPPARALSRFLTFVGNSPCVAFHAPFDRTVLERALRGELGVHLSNPWLDLAALAPALFPEARLVHGTLDDWLAYFRLQVHTRHDAVHDASATAELLLILLARARARNAGTLAQLRALEHAYRSHHSG